MAEGTSDLSRFAVKDEVVETEVLGEKIKIKKLSGYALLKRVVGDGTKSAADMMRDAILATVVEPKFTKDFIENEMSPKFFTAIGAKVFEVHGQEIKEINELEDFLK